MVSSLYFRPEGQLVSCSRAVEEFQRCARCPSEILFFFKNQLVGKRAPTIVLKDRDAKALAAHVVPYKEGNFFGVGRQASRKGSGQVVNSR